MATSTGTDEQLLWELQQRKDKSSASRASRLLIRNFFLVVTIIALTLAIATWFAAPARHAVLR